MIFKLIICRFILFQPDPDSEEEWKIMDVKEELELVKSCLQLRAISKLARSLLPPSWYEPSEKPPATLTSVAAEVGRNCDKKQSDDFKEGGRKRLKSSSSLRSRTPSPRKSSEEKKQPDPGT